MNYPGTSEDLLYLIRTSLNFKVATINRDLKVMSLSCRDAIKISYYQYSIKLFHPLVVWKVFHPL